MKKNKLVLAYSGGLDTSYAVKYLSDKGYEVHAAMVDTGGFDEKDIEEAKKKAEIMGAASFRVLDVQESYYEQCIKYLIFGNVLRRSEEHTSELQSRGQLGCRLLLEKKKMA